MNMNSASDSRTTALYSVAQFKWRGRLLDIHLDATRDSCSIVIAPRNGSPECTVELDEAQVHNLQCAANIVLEYDATRAKAVAEGEAVRVDAKRFRSEHSLRPRTADEVLSLRPQIEELIAPLVLEPIQKPALRPFQESGVQWLIGRKAGILADDMGLGKTAQALRALEGLVERGVIRSALVICPKSLIANWEAECARWVPGLTVVSCVPVQAKADEVWSAIIGRSHIIITSYEQLRPPPKPLILDRLQLIVADEAHRLRRSQSKLVQGFRRINFERIWALTGTPIERHEIDLATLLSLLEPTRFSAKSVAVESGSLRARARPYLLRRLKKDVLTELPEVIDTKELLELTPQQHRAYNAARSQSLSNDVNEALQRFTLLRSLCDIDPKSGSSVKLDRVVDILQLVKDAGEKAVVFSYLLHPLDVLRKRLARDHPSLETVSMTGELTTDERARVIQKFKSDQRIVALLCSSRVGGEGLTLTEANHVIFINEWWNPSANAQARDRVVRLGQKRVVQVHRFRCQGTIEEALDQILNRKSEAFANVVDALSTGAQPNLSESNELLGEILREISLLPIRGNRQLGEI